MPEINKRQLIRSPRTLTRLICAQILYQFDFFNEQKPLEEVKSDLLGNYVLFEDDKEKSYHDKIDEKMLDNLITGVLKIKDMLDEDIASLQKNDQDCLTKQILRLGSLELKLATDIDAAVIIDEYTKISSFFFEDDKIGFCNSILQNLAQKYDRK